MVMDCINSIRISHPGCLENLNVSIGLILRIDSIFQTNRKLKFKIFPISIYNVEFATHLLSFRPKSIEILMIMKVRVFVRLRFNARVMNLFGIRRVQVLQKRIDSNRSCLRSIPTYLLTITFSL